MFLEKLSRVAGGIEGARALALVGSDGIPIETVKVAEDIDLEVLTAEALAHIQQIRSNHEEFAVGGVRQFSLVTRNNAMMVSRLVPDYYLLLVMTPQASLGRARYLLRRARLDFEDELL